MFKEDYLMNQIEIMARTIANMLFDKNIEPIEIIDMQGMISSEGLLLHRLKAMVAQDHINEAENLLFEELEHYGCEQFFELAVKFYEDLNEMSDEKLSACEFSRDEIFEGLEQVKRLLDNIVLVQEYNGNTNNRNGANYELSNG